MKNYNKLIDLQEDFTSQLRTAYEMGYEDGVADGSVISEKISSDEVGKQSLAAARTILQASNLQLQQIFGTADKMEIFSKPWLQVVSILDDIEYRRGETSE